MAAEPSPLQCRPMLTFQTRQGSAILGGLGQTGGHPVQQWAAQHWASLTMHSAPPYKPPAVHQLSLEAFSLPGGQQQGDTHVRLQHSRRHPHIHLPQHAFVSVLNQLVSLIHLWQHQAEHLRNMRLPNLHLRRQRREHAQAEGSSSNAQRHAWFGHRKATPAQHLYESGRALERQLDPVAAAQAFEAAVSADPTHCGYMALAAKSWSDASYTAGCTPEQAQEFNRKAMEWADRAVEANPKAAYGYIVRCVSRGRLALLMDNRTKVQLAREACDDAALALQLEPKNDYAHHLMGRWHYEMAGLNPVARTLVRWLFGQSLMQGSYVQALDHFRTATQLAPHMLVHRVELGRTLAKLGNTEEAIKELQDAVVCEVSDLNAHLQKLDAELMLSKLPSSGTPALPAAAAVSASMATPASSDAGNMR